MKHHRTAHNGEFLPPTDDSRGPQIGMRIDDYIDGHALIGPLSGPAARKLAGLLIEEIHRSSLERRKEAQIDGGVCPMCLGAGRIWCAKCGAWGDHSSGGCSHGEANTSSARAVGEPDGVACAPALPRSSSVLEPVAETPSAKSSNG